LHSAVTSDLEELKNIIFSNTSNFLMTQHMEHKFYNLVQLVAKKKGNEHFTNVNLVLSICQLIVYLTIPTLVSKMDYSLEFELLGPVSGNNFIGPVS
jgi:uncharacterized membrane protein